MERDLACDLSGFGRECDRLLHAPCESIRPDPLRTCDSEERQHMNNAGRVGCTVPCYCQYCRGLMIANTHDRERAKRKSTR